MEHRDSPEIEPEPSEQVRSRPGRRFARLVESPVSRRVALPRLIVAGSLLLFLAAAMSYVVAKLLQSAARWVERRPEHRIKFSQIELSPPPDPWVVGGPLRILQDVVGEGKSLDEPVSLLEIDLKELERDFRRCVWVKDVFRIDRTRFGHLTVTLAYRKPVAVVPLARFKPGAFVVDEEAVVLPDKPMDWTSNKDPYLLKGMTAPLVTIEGLEPSESTPLPKYGLPWKRKLDGDSIEEPDPMILRAARLARFLQERKQAMKSPTEVPDFKSIYLPHGPDEPFFLLDCGENWVCWGKALGDEKPGDLSPEVRWGMLVDWVKTHGPLVAKGKDSLDLRGPKARIQKGNSSGKK